MSNNTVSYTCVKVKGETHEIFESHEGNVRVCEGEIETNKVIPKQDDALSFLHNVVKSLKKRETELSLNK